MRIASLFVPVLLITAAAGGTAFAAEASAGKSANGSVSAPAKKLLHHEKHIAPAKPSAESMKQ